MTLIFPLTFIMPENYPDFISEWLAILAVGSKTWEFRGIEFTFFLMALYMAYLFYKKPKYNLSQYNVKSPSFVTLGFAFLLFPLVMTTIFSTDTPQLLPYAVITVAFLLFAIYNFNMSEVLTAQLPKSYAFLIGLFFIMPGYNRILFIIVHILILTLPQLRKRLLCWFAAWLFFGLLGILFYPLNGIAVMVGSFPLGVCLFWNFRNKQGVSIGGARKFAA